MAEKVHDDLASKRTRGFYNALSASSVGLELGVAVILALLGGMWLDSQLGTEPWFMLVGLVIGLIAGFRNVLRAVDRSDRAAAREARRGESPLGGLGGEVEGRPRVEPNKGVASG